MPANWKINHSSIYFLGLSLMVIALPLSKFLMSSAQFILVINYLLEGKYKEKIQSLLHNKAAIVIVSLFLLHIAGLIYTSDFDYAWKDIRTKLPILALTVIIATTNAIDGRKFKYLMMIFIGAVFFGTIISSYILISRQINDIREISIFISHIRFSLNICLAIFVLLYFIVKDKENSAIFKSLLSAITIWFIVFLFLSESMSGLIILVTTAFIVLIYYLIKRSSIYYGIGFVVILIIAGVISSISIKKMVDEVHHINPVNFSKLKKFTPRGNEYWHDTTSTSTENGNYIWINISMKELRNEWNKRSDFDFDSLDVKSQHLSFTLIRFLTSKGLRKDFDGISQLTDDEIALVERGIANVKYQEKSNIRSRIHKIIWEYRNVQETKDPSGHSVVQRFEYWKASLGIIKINPIIGVGTGDMNIAFKDQYRRMNTTLEPKYQWRSHNQFLSIFVGFGIIGLLWFLFVLIYPPLKLHKFGDYFYLCFFIILILSMMWEDTIESQAGVTFFAFFNALFLFGRNEDAGI